MKVSVLLANYNHASTLRRCVEGIQDQTHGDWELVVVDDASTDNSAEVIAELAAADARIRPFWRAQNGGAIAAYRQGFEHVTGEFFLGVAADDWVVDPTFMAWALAEFAARPGLGGVFGECQLVTPDARHEAWRMGSARAPGFVAARDACADFFAGRLFVPGASALWRLDLVRAIGSYHAELGPQCDYYMNHAVPMLAGVVYADRVVTNVVVSDTTYSGQASNEDFIRYHAAVETKLRDLRLVRPPEADEILGWRRRMLEERLGAHIQRGFFGKVAETQESIRPFLRGRYSPDFLAMLDDVQRRCDEQALALESSLAEALAQFGALAPPLPQPVDQEVEVMWASLRSGRTDEARGIADALVQRAPFHPGPRLVLALAGAPLPPALLVSPALTCRIEVEAAAEAGDLACLWDGEALEALPAQNGRGLAFLRPGREDAGASWTPRIEFRDGRGEAVIGLPARLVIDLQGVTDPLTGDLALAPENLHGVERDSEGRPIYRWTGPGSDASVRLPVWTRLEGQGLVRVVNAGANDLSDVAVDVNGSSVISGEHPGWVDESQAAFVLPAAPATGWTIRLNVPRTVTMGSDTRKLGIAWAQVRISVPLAP